MPSSLPAAPELISGFGSVAALRVLGWHARCSRRSLSRRAPHA
jgi:hypothetical protein